jgi:tetratricopeptide (TPR) repeat protein
MPTCFPLLAVCSRIKGSTKYEMAKRYIQQSLNKRKDVLGENHPNTITSMNNLASLYQRQGRYEEAERLYLECWSKSKDALGENHPHTLTSINKMSAETQGCIIIW